jgi:hypothetical protein
MEDISPSGVLIRYMIGAQKGVPCHIHPFSMFTRTSTRQNIHTRIWRARVSTEELDFITEKSRGNTQISCKAPTADLAASVEHDSSLYSKFGNFLHYKTESKSSENELWFLAPPLTGASGKV